MQPGVRWLYTNSNISLSSAAQYFEAWVLNKAGNEAAGATLPVDTARDQVATTFTLYSRLVVLATACYIHYDHVTGLFITHCIST